MGGMHHQPNCYGLVSLNGYGVHERTHGSIICGNHTHTYRWQLICFFFIPVEHAAHWTSAQTATYLSPNGVTYLTRAKAYIFSQHHTQHIYPTCLTCFV
jgi:hypothetical protein